MFEHVEPYAGDPILRLNEAFQTDPRPHKVNLSIGIYFDDAGRIPVLESVRHAEAQVLARDGAQALPADRRRGQLPRAVQELLFGAEHEALAGKRVATIQSVGSSGGLQGRRRLPQPLASRQRGLGQRPDLGQPPLDVRRRRLRGPPIPYYDPATGGAGVRRDVRGAARAAAARASCCCTPAATTRPAST